MMDKHVIIVAGGIGKRFKSKIPKQFLKLADKTVLMHSIKAFFDAVVGIKIIIAIPEGFFDLWKKLCDEYKFTIPHTLAKGGETRFHSVKNALEHIGDYGLIAVHDGVRPVVSQELIRRSFAHAEKYGNAIPAVPVNDSLRILKGGHYKIINRDNIKIIQTPQSFEASVLKKAYQQNYTVSFTDDATVVESFGETIHLIDGEANNIKITRDIDLITAEALLNQ